MGWSAAGERRLLQVNELLGERFVAIRFRGWAPATATRADGSQCRVELARGREAVLGEVRRPLGPAALEEEFTPAMRRLARLVSA